MSGHLSLKWNNHSSSLLRSLTKVQTKEQYCDATIACQGKYFPVHRIVLSTCSEYFEEIFERIQNQHPYIIFKDIEPREMELLLNYMYQGEVNVLQENLPMLIKAAECLKIKGLAVPDDVPVKEPPPTKKRSSNSSDYPHSKRRPEEKRRRRESNEGHSSNNENDENYSNENYTKNIKTDNSEELKVIKEEPVDTSYEDSDLSKNFEIPITEEKITDSNNEIQDFTSLENVNFVKDGNIVPNEPFENQSSSWSSYNEGDQVGNLSAQDDVFACPQYTTFSAKDSDYKLHSECTVETENNFDKDLLNLSQFQEDSITTPQSDSNFNLGHSSGLCNTALKDSPLAHSSQTLSVALNLKRFPCSMCSLKFHMKNDLRRHIRVHTGEKPYSCPRCFRKFNRKFTLRSHLAKKNACAPHGSS